MKKFKFSVLKQINCTRVALHQMSQLSIQREKLPLRERQSADGQLKIGTSDVYPTLVATQTDPTDTAPHAPQAKVPAAN